MEKKTTKDTLFNIVVLIIGLIVFLVGALTFHWKIAGTRGWGTVEGILPQIGGIIFMLTGLYCIVSAIRNLSLKFRK